MTKTLLTAAFLTFVLSIPVLAAPFGSDSLANSAPYSDLLRRTHGTLNSATFSQYERAASSPSYPSRTSEFPEPLRPHTLLGRLQPNIAFQIQSDTILEWKVDHWVPSYRVSYLYNGLGENVSRRFETFDASAWTNTALHLFTYDGSGRLATKTLQVWNATAWVNQSLTTFTYDGDGNFIRSLDQSWNGSGWVNGSRTTLTYVGIEVVSRLSESWANNAWDNFRLESFSYDADGNLILDLMQIWLGNTWTDQSRNTSAYDVNGDELTRVTENWNGSSWGNFIKTDNVYGGINHKILDTDFIWTGSTWTGSAVDSFIFTGANLTRMARIGLIGGDGQLDLYSYDSNQNLTEHLLQAIDLQSHDWVNVFRTLTVWTPVGASNCCIGIRGNVNGQGATDLADLSSLVNYLTGSGFVFPCADAANVNGSGTIDLVDLSSLANFLTGGGFTPPACP